jgi:squalene cyclase
VKKALLLLILCCFVTLRSEASVWYGVNYDAKTVAAMVAAYGTETATEKYYSEQVQKILDRYSAAEVASAGIFMSKYLDRKAMTELGVWSSRTENYYYRRIYSLVSSKIMPKV